MKHRSNIFGLFGGSRPRKATHPTVDPKPYFERASELSYTVSAPHYLVKAPNKNGSGPAWYWLTSSRTGVGVQGFQRVRGGSTIPKRYWSSESPWDQIRKNLRNYRSPEREKFVYIDAYTGETEGPLTLADIQTRKNTTKIITPAAIIDSVMMDLLAEPPGKRDVLLAWLLKPENTDWAKGYARSVMDGRKTPSKPAPKPLPAPRGKAPPPVRLPEIPSWTDREDILLLNHNNALIQAFSESFKHVWPKWRVYREATLQYVKEKGTEGVSNLTFGGGSEREYLKKYFSGTGKFKKSAFIAPTGVSKYPKIRQDDRFVPAYIPTDKIKYDSPVLLVETDGSYGIGPVADAEFPRDVLAYGGAEFSQVLPRGFLLSIPSNYAEDRSIRLKYLRVTWPPDFGTEIGNAENLDTPEKITAFFKKANSEPPPWGPSREKGYSIQWIFGKAHVEGEGGVDPFLLSYVSYRMGPMILTQPRGGKYSAGFMEAIMGYPIDQDYVQADRPPNLEESDQVAVIMPIRMDV